MPVHDGHQVQKPALDWDVGHICAPHLISPCDSQISQEIGRDPMLRVGWARAWFLISGAQPHQAHQPPHAMPPDGIALSL